MKDIDGIEQAVAVLRPHWQEIEADFGKQNQRYLDLVAADHDAIGRVLRAHLVIESNDPEVDAQSSMKLKSRRI